MIKYNDDSLKLFAGESQRSKLHIHQMLLWAKRKNESIRPSVDPRFDYHAPKGLKRLEWDGDVYVQIVYCLNKIPAEWEIPQDNNSKLYIVYEISNISLEYNSSQNVIFISVQELEDTVCSIPKRRNKSNLRIETAENEYELFDIKSAFRKNKISLFLGAGVSMSLQLPNWSDLLNHLCEKKGIQECDDNLSNLEKGRIIIEEYRNSRTLEISEEFYQDMHDILYKDYKTSSPLVEAIVDFANKFNVESIINYNYDDLIEHAINEYSQKHQGKKKSKSIYNSSQGNINKNEIPVYHVHGYLPYLKSKDHSNIILGEKEYHDIYAQDYNWSTVEQLHALHQNICIFIGLSMSDPNLRRLLDYSHMHTNVRLKNYVFIIKEENDTKRLKTNYMEKTMMSFGINCLWYNKHEELPEFIKSLCGK